MSRLSSAAALALALAAVAACAPKPQPAPPTPAPQPAPSTGIVAVTPPVLTPPTLDRGQVPVLGPVKPLHVPEVQQRMLANGMRLLVVEHHELPVMDAALIVRTGGEADPTGRTGVAGLVAGLLTEGTTSRSSLAIADQEAFLGIELGASSGWDASTIDLHAPTAVMDSALALFADVALHPSFPAAELERVRKERLTSLLQLRDRPSAIANQAFSAIVFGGAHPYGRPLAGTEETVKRLSRADLTGFYRTYYRPNNATLVVVGDVNVDDMARRAEAMFAGWQKGTVPVTTLATATPPAKTTVYLIDKPGAPQSSVRIGTVGVARSTEDYFPLLVMNTILGDAFTSRLNQNLRETHGYTYGAFSGFGMRRAPGPFIAQAEVTAAKTDSSLLEFMKELRGIREPVPAEELAKAKRYLQLQLPNEFETTRDIASKLQAIATYDLPLDYYDTYAQRIDAVTAADVQRVADRYVTPSNLAVIVVGDRKTIEQGLRAASLGDVELRGIHGEPLPTSRR